MENEKQNLSFFQTKNKGDICSLIYRKNCFPISRYEYVVSEKYSILCVVFMNDILEHAHH